MSGKRARNRFPWLGLFCRTTAPIVAYRRCYLKPGPRAGPSHSALARGAQPEARRLMRSAHRCIPRWTGGREREGQAQGTPASPSSPVLDREARLPAWFAAGALRSARLPRREHALLLRCTRAPRGASSLARLHAQHASPWPRTPRGVACAPEAPTECCCLRRRRLTRAPVPAQAGAKRRRAAAGRALRPLPSPFLLATRERTRSGP